MPITCNLIKCCTAAASNTEKTSSVSCPQTEHGDCCTHENPIMYNKSRRVILLCARQGFTVCPIPSSGDSRQVLSRDLLDLAHMQTSVWL